MQNPSLSSKNNHWTVPSREQAYAQTLEHLAIVFQRNEKIWIVHEHYDDHEISWAIDVVRRGSMDRWVRQRYRFDAQPETLHFRGERIINEQELDLARRTGKPFAVGALK